MEPSYRRIADTIADRIADGTLRPGTAVPSTRQVVAEWGVAMATASKALADLRRRGLVRAVPGVGTIVCGTDDSQVSGTDLADASILAAAVRIADAEGLDALTMRRVAAALDTAPMSLYRHVTGKEDLLLQMREWVFGRLSLPSTRPPGWRARLETGARALWRMYRAHPWLSRTPSLTRPVAGPHQMAYSEWSLGTLRTLGLSREVVLQLHLSLFNFVHGSAASLEAESREQADSGLDPDRWMAAREAQGRAVFSSGAFPESAEVFLADDVELHLDRLFEVGLSLLLDGIAVLVGRQRSRRA